MSAADDAQRRFSVGQRLQATITQLPSAETGGHAIEVIASHALELVHVALRRHTWHVLHSQLPAAVQLNTNRTSKRAMVWTGGRLLMHMAVQSEAAAAAAGAAAEKRVATKAAPGRIVLGTVTHVSPLAADVRLESGEPS